MPQEDTVGSLSAILRGGALGFSGRLGRMGLAFLVQILLVRYLSPSRYGQFTLALTVATFLGSVFVLGTNVAVAKFVPERVERDGEFRPLSLLGPVFLLSVLSGTIIGGLVYLCADTLAALLLDTAEGASLIRIFALFVPVITVGKFASSAFRALERPIFKSTFEDLLRKVLQLAAILSLYILGGTVFDLSWLYLLAYAIPTIVAVAVLSRIVDLTDPLDALEPGLLVDLLSFSWPLVLVTLSWQMLGWADVTMLGLLSTDTRVGFYNVVLPLSSIPPMVLSALGFLYMPVLSRAVAGTVDTRRASEMYQAVSRWSMLACAPLLAVALTHPFLIVTTLFGSQYAPAGEVLRILVVGYFVHAVVGPNGVTLTVFDHNFVRLIDNLLILCFNILLNITLIPRYGAVGAAIATTVSIALINAVMQAQVWYLTGVYPVSKPQFGYGVILGAVFTAAWAVSRVLLPLAILQLMIYPAVALGAALLVLHYTNTLTQNDYKIFNELIGSLR